MKPYYDEEMPMSDLARLAMAAFMLTDPLQERVRYAVEWCIVHSSNGRGPGPDNEELCHYSALRRATGRRTRLACQWWEGTLELDATYIELRDAI